MNAAESASDVEVSALGVVGSVVAIVVAPDADSLVAASPTVGVAPDVWSVPVSPCGATTTGPHPAITTTAIHRITAESSISHRPRVDARGYAQEGVADGAVGVSERTCSDLVSGERALALRDARGVRAA
jgi:hypothetical protein